MKVVLVTGASSGFGKLITEALLERGYHVIAGLRGGEARAKSVYGKHDHLTAIDLHMERPETFESAVQFIKRQFNGRLDGLINNAGYGLMGPIELQTEIDIRQQFEVNFFGVVGLTQKLLPFLISARGRILNISSAVGFISLPFYGFYCATKFALEGYTESLAHELKAQGVQVGLVEPGAFQTQFNSTMAASRALTQDHPVYRQTSQKFVEMSLQKSDRIAGNPQRVARKVVRLMERRSVPIRNPVGLDAWVSLFARKCLPEGLRFRIIHWIFGLVLKH